MTASRPKGGHFIHPSIHVLDPAWGTSLSTLPELVVTRHRRLAERFNVHPSTSLSSSRRLTQLILPCCHLPASSLTPCQLFTKPGVVVLVASLARTHLPRHLAAPVRLAVHHVPTCKPHTTSQDSTDSHRLPVPVRTYKSPFPPRLRLVPNSNITPIHASNSSIESSPSSASCHNDSKLTL